MESDAIRGHLDAMILATLEHEPLHGYAVIEALRARSGGALAVPSGTLYPALRRLERAGHLASEWSVVSGRRRRTYRLTGPGRRLLAHQREGWRSFSEVVDAVLAPATDPGGRA